MRRMRSSGGNFKHKAGHIASVVTCMIINLYSLEW